MLYSTREICFPDNKYQFNQKGWNSAAKQVLTATDGEAGQAVLLWVSPKYYTILKLQPSCITYLKCLFLLILFHLPLVPEEEEKLFLPKKNLSAH